MAGEREDWRGRGEPIASEKTMAIKINVSLDEKCNIIEEI